MSESCCEHIQSKMLNVADVDWKNLSSHPSEFVRIDERLRLKEVNLMRYGHHSISEIASEEISKHLRMIKNMRNLLFVHARQYFGLELSPIAIEKSEINNLNINEKNETIKVDNYFIMEFIIRETADRLNTEKFYKKLLSRLMYYPPACGDMEAILEKIIKHVTFQV